MVCINEKGEFYVFLSKRKIEVFGGEIVQEMTLVNALIFFEVNFECFLLPDGANFIILFHTHEDFIFSLFSLPLDHFDIIIQRWAD